MGFSRNRHFGALAKKDGPTLCRAAHTFKGLLAMFHAEGRRAAMRWRSNRLPGEERWSVAAAEEMSLRPRSKPPGRNWQAFVGA